ncbi:sulfatase [Pontiella sulfatireligans]|uniref:Arylsulfatase n=1 Tax=Pontiella sulfatireligans TaxID=2750658 RepID=A0A6C2UHH1_9BACT|nr:sulfatase [Pontiella sulfatireligans]SPS74315.1 sulfatase S1_16 [Kiritimatiellales bacterium]VGO19313.1 Arylsulfatase [Pontiella sulfatireligans]
MKMKMFNRMTVVLAFCLCGGATIGAQPNIVLILADDQGWNGLSIPMDPKVPESASDYYQTPNLARMAEDGMRFSQGYAAAPVCSPSRHSIQFGMSPAKTRVTCNKPNYIQLCDPKQALPNLIKQADGQYATAHFGKWHVSIDPGECGYDESDGPTDNKEGNSKNIDDPKCTFEVTDRAVAFMKKQAESNQPFFVQVSYYADHLPFRPSLEMKEKYKALPPGERHSDSVFAGMNEDLDRGVGRLLDSIDQLGISDNTYIVYTADNGFAESNSKLHGIAKRKAWPLSYSKGYVREGGIRVPFIVRGPGIKAGVCSDAPVVGYDLMPTFLEWINPEFKLPEVTEGGSLVPVLQHAGEGRVKRKNDFLVFHYPMGEWPSLSSMIVGDYKLMKIWARDRVELYNLRDDISESKDISTAYPEKAEQMDEVMMKYLDSINAMPPTQKDLEIDRMGELMMKCKTLKGKKSAAGKGKKKE